MIRLSRLFPWLVDFRTLHWIRYKDLVLSAIVK
jgi:hypothetical protein